MGDKQRKHWVIDEIRKINPNLSEFHLNKLPLDVLEGQLKKYRSNGRKRRRLTKEERRAVYDKMSGRCAYCGCELEYQDMQVDHVVPLNGYSVQGRDELDNMLPACRSCNHYKASATLEGFRKLVENMPHALARDSVTYRNAVRFGLVEPKPHHVIFYFELMEGE